MIKRLVKSRIEIWQVKYINAPEERQDADKHAIIEQIEPTGNPDNFIVEVYDEAEEDPDD